MKNEVTAHQIINIILIKQNLNYLVVLVYKYLYLLLLQLNVTQPFTRGSEIFFLLLAFNYWNCFE